MNKRTLGEAISKLLADVEYSIWEHQKSKDSIIGISKLGFRGAYKVFITCIQEEMWKLQELEEMDMEDRIKMSKSCGEKLREFVKIYTDIDTLDLYDRE